MQAATLAVVGIGVTLAVYGAVGLIVKMDDVGLYIAQNGRTALGRSLGHGLVKSMPWLMKILTIVGTAAMLWVGGSIIIHGLEELGFGWLGHHIHDWAYGDWPRGSLLLIRRLSNGVPKRRWTGCLGWRWVLC